MAVMCPSGLCLGSGLRSLQREADRHSGYGWDCMARREQILENVAHRILRLPSVGVVKVGIDGVDGAGKTTFADELARVLQNANRPVIRASVDGFHHPRAIRYARGRSSPEGYFADSYDYAALRAALLDPLCPGGSGYYRVAIFDHRSDSPVPEPERHALPTSILVFDGISSASFGAATLLGPLGLPPDRLRDLDVEMCQPRRYVSRSHGCRQSPLCRGTTAVSGFCVPSLHATVTIDNNDLAMPFFVQAPA